MTEYNQVNQSYTYYRVSVLTLVCLIVYLVSVVWTFRNADRYKRSSRPILGRDSQPADVTVTYRFLLELEYLGLKRFIRW